MSRGTQGRYGLVEACHHDRYRGSYLYRARTFPYPCSSPSSCSDIRRSLCRAGQQTDLCHNSVMDWAGDRSLLDRHIAKPSEWISKKTFVRGLSQYSIVLVYIVHWGISRPLLSGRGRVLPWQKTSAYGKRVKAPEESPLWMLRSEI